MLWPWPSKKGSWPHAYNYSSVHSINSTSSFSPPPKLRFVPCIFMYLAKISALSSLVDSRRIVLTHAIGALRSWYFFPKYIQINHSNGRTHSWRFTTFFFYKKLKNVSCEYYHVNGWNSTLQAAWYIRYLHKLSFARVLCFILMKDIGRWLPWMLPGSTGRFFITILCTDTI